MYPVLICRAPELRQAGPFGHVRNVDVAPTIAALLGLECAAWTGGC